MPPRPLSPRFTGQELYLDKLRNYFGQPSSLRRRFLLYGKGGVGKTQLALKFAEENADRYVDSLHDAYETLTCSVFGYSG